LHVGRRHLAKDIQRAGDPGGSLAGDVGIDHGGFQAFMSEQNLNRAQIDAAFQQVGGEAVARSSN
jgi:hypothetical protein